MIPIAKTFKEAQALFDQGHRRIMCIADYGLSSQHAQECTTAVEAMDFFA